MATAKTRQKILDTFLAMVAERGYAALSLSALADEAGVKLSVLRENFGSKRDLVKAFAARIDSAVLDERDIDMADQPARDRLFDILMTRIDHMTPHKAAVRALLLAARKDPVTAFDFNQIAVTSQNWMLIAAGIELGGVKSKIVAQGLAIAFARVVETWLDEDDEGMPRTMAKLDRELDRGVSWMKRLDRAEGIARSASSFGDSMRKRRARHSATGRDAPVGDGEGVTP